MTSARWRLVHGDALTRLLTRLPGESVDALITDPPYSSGGFTRGDRMKDPSLKYRQTGASRRATSAVSFGGDNRDQRSYLAWSTLWLSECWRALKGGGVACVFTDWRQLPITTDAFQAAGFVWRGTAVWAKSFSRPTLGRFRPDAEFLVWGSKGPMPIDPKIGVLPGAWTMPPVCAAHRMHMTEKPLALMDAIVRIVHPGRLVLDPFAGAGTTGAAALRRGCRFIGAEASPHYHEIASKRLREAARDARREAA